MITSLTTRLREGKLLTINEREAIIYILSEYEKLQRTTGESVVLEMSQDMFNEVMQIMYKIDGNSKLANSSTKPLHNF